MGWAPKTWAGWIPTGLGQVKPHHFLDMLKVGWRNRDQLPFSWRILTRGVCDGCALGTTGLRDFTMKGVHLCAVRLNLLRLNTMPALDVRLLADVEALRRKSSRELRNLGRLAFPMLRRRGEPGFARVSWDQALGIAASRIRRTDPDRLAFYLTSRGITNEVYYLAQKVARFLGTNNVDNSARLCHAPSTVAMKGSLGVAASTCSYKDWIGTDWLIFIGSDTPNNQPVTTKYMYYAKQKGTRIAVINPLREPGLERYWIPSVTESALFGTRLADEFYTVHTGGDVAFLNGVLKSLIESGGVDSEFIDKNTEGFAELKAELETQDWKVLEDLSGSSKAEMSRLADHLSQAKTAVFVWSMGVTQHACGVDNVRAIVNLALSRGMIGRQKCGLMPIRGHSGVQGGAEVGCVPNAFPGGRPVDGPNALEFSEMWGFEVPAQPGLAAGDMIGAARAGNVDVLYSVGGNFLETLPDPDSVRRALERVPLRIHQDIVLSSQMLAEPAQDVLLLPACTRYEQPGGGTETTTERYIIFSPEIEGRRIGEARSEWKILMGLAEAVYPDRRREIHFEDGAAVRREIARAVPAYQGIEDLHRQGDAIQWGGERLCEGGRFSRPGGRARFSALRPAFREIAEGTYFLSTRRGKQFNSMIQSERDPLTGARREDVLMNPGDMESLGVKEGQDILLRSPTGRFRGRAKPAPIQPRNLQVHWPEGNVLLDRDAREPLSGVPDYNARVELLRPDGSRFGERSRSRNP